MLVLYGALGKEVKVASRVEMAFRLKSGVGNLEIACGTYSPEADCGRRKGSKER